MMRGSRVACCCWLLLAACVEQSSTEPTAADLRIIERNLLKEVPQPRIRVNSELEDKLVYLGLDADEKAERGRPLRLAHYWRVKKPVGDDWKLFVHLNGKDGKGSFQNADHTPVKGRYPVSQWKAGDVIRDAHSVRIPSNWKGDVVEVYVGIWRGKTRLAVAKGKHDGKNRAWVASIPVGGRTPATKRYTAVRRQGAIKIDGHLEEPDWKRAASSGPFVDTLTGDRVEDSVDARAVWDDEKLYVSFKVADKDVVSEFKKHDDELWTQDVVEMFIDADGDGKDYIELQVSPAGVTFDSYLPTRRKNQNDWESGMEAAASVDGTLNAEGDTDRGWSAELALPLAAVVGPTKKKLPAPSAPDTVWRVNWFRMNGKGRGQKAASWSPPLVGDFHVPGRFGELRFKDPKRERSNRSSVTVGKSVSIPDIRKRRGSVKKSPK